jgi:protein involved in polysaccharide export with SLBB domain
LTTGCALGRSNLDQALLTNPGAEARNRYVAECYLVHCPDVLEVAVAGRPDLSGRRVIGPDGRIDLGESRLRVEGRTLPECSRLAAQELLLPPEQVRIRVAEYRSQQVYLFGQVMGLQRAVPYQGPETILDLLQRTGGITRGAAPDDVYVVRPHLVEGRPPEVFHIQMSAILMNQDQRTNLRLQPFDRIYIGQTGPSRLTKCFPAWLQPVYEAFWGLSPSQGDAGPFERGRRSEE